MKTYSLGSPSHGAGVYYIENKRTGQIYVGQTVGLRRRFSEWKNGLGSGFGHVNLEMYDAFMKAPDLDEWVFVVAFEMPGASKEELLSAEANEVSRLKNISPNKVLNNPFENARTTVKAPGHPQGAISIRLPSGGFVGQGTAAKLIGRNPDTIRSKIRYLKEKGITEIELNDLTMDVRKIAHKYLVAEDTPPT